MSSYNVQYLIDEEYLCSIINRDITLTGEFLNIIEQCDLPNAQTLVTDRLYSKDLAGISFANYVYSPEAIWGDDRDFFLRLTRVFDTFTEFDPLSLPTYTASSDDFQAYAIHQKDIGLLTNNEYAAEAWWDKATMVLVPNQYSPIGYYRFYIDKIKIDEDDLWSISKNIFPNIFFNINSAVVKMGKFNFKHPDLFSWVIQVISYLNDHAREDFLSGDTKNFIARAASHGLDVSPESPKTKASTAKMRERNITVAQSEICCEWHAKFKHDKGRIHFHIGAQLSDDVMSITKDKVIVGIFCEHLSV